MNNDVRAKIDLTEAITVQVRFADGGSPAPQPAPVSIYSDFAAVFTNVLTGSVATYEEVNNGD